MKPTSELIGDFLIALAGNRRADLCLAYSRLESGFLDKLGVSSGYFYKRTALDAYNVAHDPNVSAADREYASQIQTLCESALERCMEIASAQEATAAAKGGAA